MIRMASSCCRCATTRRPHAPSRQTVRAPPAWRHSRRHSSGATLKHWGLPRGSAPHSSVLLELAEAEVRAGAGDEGGWVAATVGRGAGTVLGRLAYGTEFVLHHLNGGAVAGGAHDAAGNNQLEGGRVVQQHRP